MMYSEVMAAAGERKSRRHLFVVTTVEGHGMEEVTSDGGKGGGEWEGCAGEGKRGMHHLGSRR